MLSTVFFGLISAIVIGVILLFVFAPRPRLDPTPPPTRVPENLTPQAAEQWLIDAEMDHGHVIEGAEACIEWANGPEKTPLVFLYIHGFSATRQETAPVTDKVAQQFGANVVYARLAGHGLEHNAMAASAEDWLQSIVDIWEISRHIGERVVVMATSTGAPLTTWMLEHVADPRLVHSLIFLSPNFRIRNSLGFLLTWPLAERWVPRLLGEERSWEPENELAGRYWTSTYSIRAIIEMQKVVDWASRVRKLRGGVPLATLYMEDDPTINHDAAISFHQDWQHDVKSLHRVELDDTNPQHVFAGDITAPHRTDWCIERCIDFLNHVETVNAQA